MQTYPSTPRLGRSSLILAIVFLSLALVLTIVLMEPSSGQKRIPSEEAADFEGYLGTVCGHVNSVRQDPEDGTTVLIFAARDYPSFATLTFGTPHDPSFAALISIRNRETHRNYEGKDVCVTGRIVDEGVPSIRVTDESLVTIE